MKNVANTNKPNSTLNYLYFLSLNVIIQGKTPAVCQAILHNIFVAVATNRRKV